MTFGMRLLWLLIFMSFFFQGDCEEDLQLYSAMKKRDGHDE